MWHRISVRFHVISCASLPIALLHEPSSSVAPHASALVATAGRVGPIACGPRSAGSSTTMVDRQSSTAVNRLRLEATELGADCPRTVRPARQCLPGGGLRVDVDPKEDVGRSGAADHRRVRWMRAVLALVMAMAIAGCVDSGQQNPDGAAAQLDRLVAQADAAPTPRLDWGRCGEPGLERYECARALVPLDYARPDGETLSLAVIRRPAADPGRRIGTLFGAVGGPGGSGYGLGSRYRSAVGRARATIRCGDLRSAWDRAQRAGQVFRR